MKIFIAGDSWGEGEQGRGFRVIHPGLEQYLKDLGYAVFNTSKSDSSNQESLTRLQSAAAENYEPGDLVLFIVTDPLRDLRPYTDLTQLIIEEGGVTALTVKMFHQACASINEQPWRTHLIGGIANYTPEMLKGYDNLVPLVPSWSELLIGHKPFFESYRNKYWSLAWSDWTINTIDIDYMKVHHPELVRQVVNELWQLDITMKEVWNDNIFRPDGVHPNRTGHLWLFNNIVEKLGL